MDKKQCTEGTILCECGHPLNRHATGCGECYNFTRRTEKKKNHKGNLVKVKCVYACTCKKFKLRDDASEVGGVE